MCIGTHHFATAQYFTARQGYWKTYRHSFGFGLGAANFLGELGGRDQIGSDFIYDLDWSETRPSLMVNYRYQLGRYVYSRAQLCFGYIGGNDALTEETFRMNRNLHFRSTVTELSGLIEFFAIDRSRRNMYETGVKPRKFTGWMLYGFAGIGVTHFNPKANFNGKWYALRPLSTEGQGLPDGPGRYSLFTVVLPLGFGIKYELNPDWTVGIEIGHRITFTDYMDDVSTVYYDNNAIFENRGELAAFLADPSLGFRIDENGQQVPLNSTFTGAQRGNPENNDSYMFAQLTAQYKFNPRKVSKSRGRITKRRARRVLF
jgi:hypothetical protein